MKIQIRWWLRKLQVVPISFLLVAVLSSTGLTFSPTPVAQAATSSCTISAETQVMTSSQKPSQFATWSDNYFGIVPADDGTGRWKFIGTDWHTFYTGVYEGGLIGTAGNVASGGLFTDSAIQNLKAGTSGGYNNRANNRRYAGTSKIYPYSSNLWIGIYHSEEDMAPGHFFSRVGLAKSTDKGVSWTDLGEIVSPNPAYDPNSSNNPDMGITNFAIVNSGGVNYMYVYFQDKQQGWTANTTNLAVARARVSDIVNSANSGNAALFYKYYQGSWNEAGLSGHSTDIFNTNAGSFNVGGDAIYNTATGRYYIVAYNNGQLQYIESTDGLNWEHEKTLFSSSGSHYMSLVSTSGNPITSGSSFYIYYTGDNGTSEFYNGNMYRRTISCSLGSGTTIVDDTSSGSGTNQFNYQGSGWGSCTSCGGSQYNNSEHWSNQSGNSFNLNFSGTQVNFYTEMGPGAGIASVWVDSGSAVDVDTYSSIDSGNNLTYSSNGLSSGTHTLHVQVTGRKNSNATNSYILPDRVDVIAGPLSVDDINSGSGINQFNYQGSGWGSCTSCGGSQYNNTEHWSNQSGNMLTVNFTGTQIKLYIEHGPGAGQADIWIDNGTRITKDAYNSVEEGNALLFDSGVLFAGNHTLNVKVNGTHNGSATDSYILPDRVEVYS